MKTHRMLLTAVITMGLAGSFPVHAGDREEGRSVWIKIEQPQDTDAQESLWDLSFKNFLTGAADELWSKVPKPGRRLSTVAESLWEILGRGFQTLKNAIGGFGQEGGPGEDFADGYLQRVTDRTKDNLVDVTDLPFNPWEVASDADSARRYVEQRVGELKHEAQEFRKEVKETVGGWIGIGEERSPDSVDYDQLTADTQGVYGAPAADQMYAGSPVASVDKPDPRSSRPTPMEQVLIDLGENEESDESLEGEGPSREDEERESAQHCMESRMKGLDTRLRGVMAMAQRLMRQISAGKEISEAEAERLLEEAEALKKASCSGLRVIHDALRYCNMPLEAPPDLVDLTNQVLAAGGRACGLNFPAAVASPGATSCLSRSQMEAILRTFR